MDNLLVTLAVGVMAIVVAHRILRGFFRLKSFHASLVVMVIMPIVYTPLLMFDWPGLDIFAIQFSIYCVSIYILGIVYSGTPPVNGERKKMHWGPMLIIGFFTVVIIMDSIFITLAQQGMSQTLGEMILPKPRSGGTVSSYFSGMVEHDYQERQAQYNKYQTRLQQQRKLGWQIKKGWQQKPYVGKPAIFKLLIKDKQGRPITQAEVTGIFQRSNTSKHDHPVELRETEPGLYQVQITLQQPGRWQLLLEIVSSQGHYEIKSTTDVYK